MSRLPETRHEMRRAFYKQLSGGECKGCHRPIEWWLTTNEKKMPFDPPKDPANADHEKAVNHFATCPDRERFRGQGAADGRPQQAAAKPTPAQSAPAPAKLDTPRLIRTMRETHGARAVVIILKDGSSCACWETGLDGEDLRTEIIAAANHVRNTIAKGAH